MKLPEAAERLLGGFFLCAQPSRPPYPARAAGRQTSLLLSWGHVTLSSRGGYEMEECPNCQSSSTTCHSSRTIDGSLSEEGGFRPDGLRFLTIRRTFVPMVERIRVCLECGLLWSRVSPVELQQLIASLGKHSTKEQLCGMLDAASLSVAEQLECHRRRGKTP